jgi:hypothetical protein
MSRLRQSRFGLPGVLEDDAPVACASCGDFVSTYGELKQRSEGALVSNPSRVTVSGCSETRARAARQGSVPHWDSSYRSSMTVPSLGCPGLVAIGLPQQLGYAASNLL